MNFHLCRVTQRIDPFIQYCVGALVYYLIAYELFFFFKFFAFSPTTFNDFNEMVSVLGTYRCAYFALFQGKGSFFKFRHHAAPLEKAQFAAVGGRSIVRILLGQFSKVSAIKKLFIKLLNLFLCCVPIKLALTLFGSN